MESAQYLAAFVLAFFCEYMDSTLGMGYGTTLTPVFLLMGFAPMQIVPVILLSELLSGLTAGFFHHREGNVNLKPSRIPTFRIAKLLRPGRCVAGLKRVMPPHLKVALLLALCSIVGTIVAVLIAISIPKFWLKLYIGCLVLTMGLIILACRKREFRFSWKRVAMLGMVASFNKGMSGGGYGPLVTGGQILSGVESRSAVGITSLAEGLTCFVGIVTYLLVSDNVLDWTLAPWVICGAMLSVPLSAKSVKRIGARTLQSAIAVLTVVLGLFTIVRTLTP